MIVTVGNTKGGTGKTTFAVQIALERQSAGKTVLLIDPGDNRDNLDTLAAIRELPQFTVAEAIVRRRKAVVNAMAHGLAVAEMPQPDRLARDEIALLTSNVFSVETS